MDTSSINRKEKLKIDKDISEIEIDLGKPRLITIYGFDKNGKKITRHIKITEKNKMALL